MELLVELRHQTEHGIIHSAITQAALEHNLSRDTYVRYLLNVWHFSLHSSKVLGIAASRLVKTHPILADFLFELARDELNIDQWALGDLANMGWSKDQVTHTRPTPSCAAMIGYEYYLASEANPLAIFGWLYILESMGEDTGQSIVANLSQHPELKNSLRFLTEHVIADVEHIKKLEQLIEQHIKGENKDEVIHAAEVIKNLYVGMFDEL